MASPQLSQPRSSRSRTPLKKPKSLQSVLSRVSTTLWQRDTDLNPSEEAERAAKDKFPTVLLLSFQAIGVIFGDIGTSPLYVLQSSFATDKGDPTEEDIIGVLSIILWTFSLIVAVKYILVVLRADDNGQGGTFALFSLLKRQGAMASAAAYGPLAASDKTIGQYSFTPQKSGLKSVGSARGKAMPLTKPSWTQRWIANKHMQRIIRLLVVTGVGFIMGDGVLTPAISVVSAIEGLQNPSALGDRLGTNQVVGISIGILLLLFVAQQFGTGKLGTLFSPIITIWLLFNGSIGMYNIVRYRPSIFRAFSPHYIFSYFIRDSYGAWISLGGIVLCVTGCEALFADLGHFSRKSIQLSTLCLVYPCLILTYLGQTAYLVGHPTELSGIFWNSLPTGVFWPMFVVATLSSIIASQALISATFQIVTQAIAAGFFPRFAVCYTSEKHRGQVYIPLINYMLMTLCLIVVGTFRTSAQLGLAYGLAVLLDMVLSTHFIVLVMLCVWQINPIFVIPFYLVFTPIEVTYLSSTMLKVPTGGWFSLMMAAIYAVVMLTWFWGTTQKAAYYARQRLRLDQFLALGASVDEQVSLTIAQQKLSVKATEQHLKRARGVGIFYAADVYGVPPVLLQCVSQLPVIYEVNVFLTNRHVSVPRVAPEERLLVEQLGASGFYHIVARYGYWECIQQDSAFVDDMLGRMLELLMATLQARITKDMKLRVDLGLPDDVPEPVTPSFAHSFKEEHERTLNGIPMGIRVLHGTSDPLQTPTRTKGPKSPFAAVANEASPRNGHGLGLPSVREDPGSTASRPLGDSLPQPEPTPSQLPEDPFGDLALPHRDLPNPHQPPGHLDHALQERLQGVVTKLTSPSTSEVSKQHPRAALLADEILVLQHAKAQRSVVYVLGRSRMRLHPEVPWTQLPRRYLLEQPFKALQEFFSTDADLAFGIPKDSLLEIGMPWSVPDGGHLSALWGRIVDSPLCRCLAPEESKGDRRVRP